MTNKECGKERSELDAAYGKIAELNARVLAIALELDAARQKIARIMAGIEGCCMTCESVGVRNQQMEREIAMLATLLAKDRLNDEN